MDGFERVEFNWVHENDVALFLTHPVRKYKIAPNFLPALFPSSSTITSTTTSLPFPRDTSGHQRQTASYEEETTIEEGFKEQWK